MCCGCDRGRRMIVARAALLLGLCSLFSSRVLPADGPDGLNRPDRDILPADRVAGDPQSASSQEIPGPSAASREEPRLSPACPQDEPNLPSAAAPGAPLSPMSPPFESGGTPANGPLPVLPMPPVSTEHPSSDRPYWRRNLFKRVLSDQKFLVTSWWPSELRRWQFTAPLVLGTMAAATSGAGDADGGPDFAFERRFHAETSGTSLRLAHEFTSIGNVSYAALGLGTGYFLSRLTGNEHLAETVSLSTEALIDAGIWVSALKGITARVRPSGGGRGAFFQFSAAHNGSFPSGHAIGAFSVATVIAHEYAGKKWVPWVAYGTATLIGASRVALGRHYPSDVVVGSMLGNSISRMVLARNNEESPLALDRFRPVADPSRHLYGAAYSYSW